MQPLMQSRKRQRVEQEGRTPLLQAGEPGNGHSYECVVVGLVEYNAVERFFKRIEALCNDATKRFHEVYTLDSVYVDSKGQQQVRATCVKGGPEQKEGKPAWKLLLKGSFHRGKDLDTPTRSIIESKVSKGVNEFLTGLGMKFLFDTATYGKLYITQDGIRLSFFRLVEPHSMKSYLDKCQQNPFKLPMSCLNGLYDEDHPALKFLIPKGSASIEKSPLMVKISMIVYLENELMHACSTLRSFVHKLGLDFVEIKPRAFAM